MMSATKSFAVKWSENESSNRLELGQVLQLLFGVGMAKDGRSEVPSWLGGTCIWIFGAVPCMPWLPGPCVACGTPPFKNTPAIDPEVPVGDLVAQGLARLRSASVGS